jgi:beta-lactamase class D
MDAAGLTFGAAIAAIILGFWPAPPLALAEPVAGPRSSDMNRFDVASLGSSTVDLGQSFRDLGVEGSIIIQEANAGRTFIYNSPGQPTRHLTEFPVASTFKILNSLIALETGILPHDLAVLTWDGVEREIATWNRDLNLREAFKVSAVWFYQVLARRLGHDAMKRWIERVQYGNQRIGTPEEIDRFWLDGQLKITPDAQIQFLRRLYDNDLPFSERTMATVKEVMLVEQTPDYAIRAKTGWYGFGRPEVQQIGWYVGYVETRDNVYFFATNLDIRRDRAAQDGAARLEVTRRSLQVLGALPAIAHSTPNGPVIFNTGSVRSQN